MKKNDTSRESRLTIAPDRRKDQGAGRLARRGTFPDPLPGQGGRLQNCRRMEVARRPGLVPRRNDIAQAETYKSVVKVTFAKGAQLKDPSGLFNSSLEGNVRRAINLHEGEKLDEPAFKALIRNAVALNASPSRG